MEKKNNNFVIVFLVFLVLILGGVICYLIFGLDKDKNTDVSNNQNENTNNNQVSGETVSNEKVITFIDYVYIMEEHNANKFQMEEYPIEIKLPQINIDTKSAKEFNQKIIVDILANGFNHHKIFIDLLNDINWEYYEGTVITYDYEIKNNIIALYINIVDKDGSSEWPASGNPEVKTNYFYDIKNDKEITSITEALPLMGYTTSDLKKFDLTNFEGLVENGSSAHYEIKDGKGEIIFYDCRQGCV